MPRTVKNSESAPGDSNDLGRFGESYASNYLRVRGYSIIATNFRAAIGRNQKGVAFTGEIDIIALKSGVLCFVEVKTRKSPESMPEIAVTLRKQRQISRVARVYERTFDLGRIPKRFDVIAVIPRGNQAPALRHLKRYWSPEKFRKRKWSGDPQHFA